ncbi:MAG: PsbP-related protein [Nitrososphaeraceae archaeon]
MMLLVSFNGVQVLMAQMNMSSSSSSMNMSAPMDYTATKFVLYKNSRLGIQVLHPLLWKPIEKNTTRGGQVVEFIPAVETEHQPLMPFVTIAIEKMQKKIGDLNSLTKQNLEIAKDITGFRIVNSSNTVLSGAPAHKIIYTFTSPPTPMPADFQSMNIWTIINNIVYTISYSEAKTEYLKHTPAIDKMVNSFEIVK